MGRTIAWSFVGHPDRRTGAPPRGPVDIVVSQDRITERLSVGFPKVPVNDRSRPAKGSKEIDGTVAVTPGFVDDMCTAAADRPTIPTTSTSSGWVTASRPFAVRLAAAWTGTSSSVSCRQRTKSSHRASSRITGRSLVRMGSQHAADARDGTRMGAIRGEEGQLRLKLGAHDPEIMAALLDESKKFGLGSTAHLDQMGVGRMNALQASRLGLVDLTHYYGLFESLLKDYSIQPYPVTQNYNDEQHRFGQVARLWDKIHPRGRALECTHQRVGRSQVHHRSHALLSQPRRDAHAAGRVARQIYAAVALGLLPAKPKRTRIVRFDWTTEDEIAWRNFYHVDVLPERLQERRWPSGNWIRLRVHLPDVRFWLHSRLRDAAGSGTPPTGSGSRRHPARCRNAARTKGRSLDFGILRAGLKADMVITKENPLQNFKTLYATGHLRLTDATNKPERRRDRFRRQGWHRV